MKQSPDKPSKMSRSEIIKNLIYRRDEARLAIEALRKKRQKSINEPYPASLFGRPVETVDIDDDLL